MLFFLSAVVNNADHTFACDIVYLDFRKAFDSVPHKELLFNLWLMCITGDLWFWFKSYLLSGPIPTLLVLTTFVDYGREEEEHLG